MKMCQLHTPVWVRDWKNKTNSASNIIMIDFEVHDCMLRVVEMNQWLYESIPCLGCMLHASSLFQISYFHPLHTAYNRPETFQLSLAVKEWYNLKVTNYLDFLSNLWKSILARLEKFSFNLPFWIQCFEKPAVIESSLQCWWYVI